MKYCNELKIRIKDLIDFGVFLVFNSLLAKISHKLIYEIRIMRDLIDAVVSRGRVTLCVAPGAAPGAGDRR